jgi:hypothetical protein
MILSHQNDIKILKINIKLKRISRILETNLDSMLDKFERNI